MPKWIKIITLIVFVSLISLFVAYRAGLFKAPSAPTSAEDKTILNTEDETSSGSEDTDQAEDIDIMSSSKSIILPVETISDENKPLNLDSIDEMYMLGSKSVQIIDPKFEFPEHD